MAETQPPISIAIHGGAGTILKANLSREMEQAYHAKLAEAMQLGYAVLQSGGSSIDAVQVTIAVLEDSPLFNAGKGAVFTHHKTNELDASIMEGKSLNAGSVAGVTRVKNPIKLAAAVMQKSPHVMLSGPGADQFAREHNLALVKPEYFFTQRRWDQLLKQLNQAPDQSALSEQTYDNQLTEAPRTKKNLPENSSIWPDDNKFGTVGAVALDKAGNLAAGTSTGGMTNKKYARIGDSAVIGAGTYADNQACAVSATGHGEFFIRAAVAHDICARVLYKKIDLQTAADEVIMQKLVAMKAEGGVVALSPQGKVVFSFNSSGMYRGYIDVEGKMHTAIFKK